MKQNTPETTPWEIKANAKAAECIPSWNGPTLLAAIYWARMVGLPIGHKRIQLTSLPTLHSHEDYKGCGRIYFLPGLAASTGVWRNDTANHSMVGIVRELLSQECPDVEFIFPEEEP